ncbi:hypothetical protein OG462_41395 [Streptomyces sp. NBC_01077]|uniref:hypothetical protein n=1 Tax=Streptomyces sp. NBC_01077 TaxID=2903746 RepID=UPI00386E1EA3|nr:hypothetical protein OG462_41395 [Streptomyces sp. NBC_01077]
MDGSGPEAAGYLVGVGAVPEEGGGAVVTVELYRACSTATVEKSKPMVISSRPASSQVNWPSPAPTSIAALSGAGST